MAGPGAEAEGVFFDESAVVIAGVEFSGGCSDVVNGHAFVMEVLFGKQVGEFGSDSHSNGLLAGIG